MDIILPYHHYYKKIEIKINITLKQTSALPRLYPSLPFDSPILSISTFFFTPSPPLAIAALASAFLGAGVIHLFSIKYGTLYFHKECGFASHHYETLHWHWNSLKWSLKLSLKYLLKRSLNHLLKLSLKYLLKMSLKYLLKGSLKYLLEAVDEVLT